MEHLQKEHNFFNENYADLIERYLYKYLVISNAEAKLAFDTELDAYIYGSQTFGIGNFILKHCVPLENQMLQTFNNRIIF